MGDLLQTIDEGRSWFKKACSTEYSYLMKLAFQFVTKLDTLWVRILRSKYKIFEVCPVKIDRSMSSYV